MPDARVTFRAAGRLIRKGQTIQDDDPVLSGRDHLFTGGTVEQATAEPGEVRDVPDGKVPCDVCGRRFKPAGLPRHQATHR